jgi:hypothetical protein
MRPLAMAVLLLAGCASQPEWLWHRADGQGIRSNPALLQRAETDLAVCEAERAKTISSSNLNAAGRMEAGDIVLRGCMMGKGYVQR